ncbi:unnamed protein product [Strongylus vulgaris]|uniref:Uncharacterized protein n=1 Tax=Strongylus vulgaris TaxID=40348 RepID=A0A3P7LNT5_STRVU|nr:unnamed protein product [Strongylus vulgaris]
MYLCPCCNFSSHYSPTSVKDHIKNRHSMYDPIPLDVRGEYTELIQSVYDRCFLDDSDTILNRIFLRQRYVEPLVTIILSPSEVWGHIHESLLEMGLRAD